MPSPPQSLVDETIRAMERYVDRDEARKYIADHARRFLATIALVPVDRPLRVLDLGAFVPLSAHLKRITPHTYTLHAAPGESPFEEVRVGADVFPVHRFDLEREPFPFAVESFDLVLCAEVLEHLGLDPFHMLSEINRVLAPGGRLILTTPNIVSTRGTMKALFGYAPYFYSAFTLSTDRHNREYTPAEVIELLGHAGFAIEELTTANVYYGPVRFPAASRVARALTDLIFKMLETSTWRGDAILARARKTGPIESRYPASFYDVARPQV